MNISTLYRKYCIFLLFVLWGSGNFIAAKNTVYLTAPEIMVKDASGKPVQVPMRVSFQLMDAIPDAEVNKVVNTGKQLNQLIIASFDEMGLHAKDLKLKVIAQIDQQEKGKLEQTFSFSFTSMQDAYSFKTADGFEWNIKLAKVMVADEEESSVNELKYDASSSVSVPAGNAKLSANPYDCPEFVSGSATPSMVCGNPTVTLSATITSKNAGGSYVEGVDYYLKWYRNGTLILNGLGADNLFGTADDRYNLTNTTYTLPAYSGAQCGYTDNNFTAEIFCLKKGTPLEIGLKDKYCSSSTKLQYGGYGADIGNGYTNGCPGVSGSQGPANMANYFNPCTGYFNATAYYDGGYGSPGAALFSLNYSSLPACAQVTKADYRIQGNTNPSCNGLYDLSWISETNIVFYTPAANYTTNNPAGTFLWSNAGYTMCGSPDCNQYGGGYNFARTLTYPPGVSASGVWRLLLFDDYNDGFWESDPDGEVNYVFLQVDYTIPPGCIPGTTLSGASLSVRQWDPINAGGNFSLPASCQSSITPICSNIDVLYSNNNGATYTLTSPPPPLSNGQVVYYQVKYNAASGAPAGGCPVTGTYTLSGVIPSPTVGSYEICKGNTIPAGQGLTASCGANTLSWWNAPIGGTQVSTSSIFEPTGYNSFAPGTYTYYAQCSNGTCASSRVAASLVINPQPVTNLTQSICQGQSVTVGTQTFNATGNYTVVLKSSKNCDSTINLALTVNPNKTTNLTRTLCQGQSITVGTQTFTTTGNYTVLLKTSTGCDSTVNLALTVNPTKTTNLTRSICQGQSVTVGTQTFTASGNYTVVLKTSANCDSTVNLALTVNPTKTTNLTRSICQGQSVTVGTQTFNTTGNYTVVLKTSANCDSTVNLALTVNPNKTTNLTRTLCQGQSVTVGTQTFTTTGNYTVLLKTSTGCDSTVNLNLTVNPTKTTNLTQSICQGQSVKIGTQTFTATGNYTVVLKTSANCDSTVNLALTVNPTKTTNLTQTICQGQSVKVGTQTFTATGNYTVLLQTSKGCDSTVNLALTVNPNKTTNLTRTLCQGQSITVGTQTFTTTGNYTVLLKTSTGCDSTVNLNLTVNPTKTTNLTQSICQGQSVKIGTQTFTATGNYTVVLKTSANCDSTVNLALTVNPAKTTNLTETICQGQSVKVGAQTFTATGNYTVLLQTSKGCDSTVNLALTVNPNKTTNLSRTICQGESVTIGTRTFTVTGNYTVVLKTSAGCDSTVNLALTVNPSPTVVFSRAICQGDSVTIGTQSFNKTGTYTVKLTTVAGCDSTVRLFLTVHPHKTVNLTQTICQGASVIVGTQTFTTTGNYTVKLQTANGCDSTVNLNLTVNPTKKTNLTQTICQGESVKVGSQTFTTSGTHVVILPTSLGCDSTITLVLNVIPVVSPAVFITSNTTDACPGVPVVFIATSNIGNAAKYQWYVNTTPVGTNSSQFSTTTLNNGDVVKVVLTSTSSCTLGDEATSNAITIKVNKVTYTKPPVEYCKLDSQQIDLGIVTNPASPFTIVWNNTTTNTNGIYTVNTSNSGNVPFSITFGNNCKVNDVLPVKVNPLPPINATVNKPAAKFEEEVQLNVTGAPAGSDYHWTPATAVSNDSIRNPTAIIRESVLFTVTVTDPKNCTNTDTVRVTLINDCFIYIPSAFSPNRDGVNDCFGLLAPPKMSEYKLLIYDRWGELMFSSNDEKACWDGTFNGDVVPVDSYSYIVTFVCHNGERLSQNGIVTVVK